VVLVDVDPGYFQKPEQYLPQAKKIIERHKLDWPNVIVPGGFNETVRVFNLSGYGNVVVDPQGIVRGVNVHGGQLEQLVEKIVEPVAPDKPAP
jgi:hypothetical protein